MGVTEEEQRIGTLGKTIFRIVLEDDIKMDLKTLV